MPAEHVRLPYFAKMHQCTSCRSPLQAAAPQCLERERQGVAAQRCTAISPSPYSTPSVAMRDASEHSNEPRAFFLHCVLLSLAQNADGYNSPGPLRLRSDSPKQEPSLERGKFRTKGLKEGQDDVRVFFKEPFNVRGKDRLLCFVSEHTVRSPPNSTFLRGGACMRQKSHAALRHSFSVRTAHSRSQDEGGAKIPARKNSLAHPAVRMSFAHFMHLTVPFVSLTCFVSCRCTPLLSSTTTPSGTWRSGSVTLPQ